MVISADGRTTVASLPLEQQKEGLHKLWAMQMMHAPKRKET
jgi:hypothetical protein